MKLAPFLLMACAEPELEGPEVTEPKISMVRSACPELEGELRPLQLGIESEEQALLFAGDDPDYEGRCMVEMTSEFGSEIEFVLRYQNLKPHLAEIALAKAVSVERFNESMLREPMDQNEVLFFEKSMHLEMGGEVARRFYIRHKYMRWEEEIKCNFYQNTLLVTNECYYPEEVHVRFNAHVGNLDGEYNFEISDVDMKVEYIPDPRAWMEIYDHTLQCHKS